MDAAAAAATTTEVATTAAAAAIPTATTSEAAAREWCRHDPNDCTARYVRNLVDRVGDDQDRGGAAAEEDDAAASEDKGAALEELRRLFPVDVVAEDEEGTGGQRRISFGTAGLRGAMQPGPTGMNDLVVVQTAQGIAQYCKEQRDKSDANARLGVAIGYDHRCDASLELSSASFAVWTAVVFRQSGYFDDVLLLDGFVATPFVPICISQMSKSSSSSSSPSFVVGIMVTASHNPAKDNGYKVYWTDGCQIRAPIDAEIAESIRNNLLPWTDYRTVLQDRQTRYPKDDPCLGLSDPVRTKRMIDAYYDAIASSGLVTNQIDRYNGDNDNETKEEQENSNTNSLLPKFCYTAMHGVGYKYSKRMFTEVFRIPESRFVSVPQQQEPDPSFPTVPFPNPEESGALRLAQSYALQHECPVILANDPDADRLAVAEYDSRTQRWTVFHGDQIGILLGHWLWTQIGKPMQQHQQSSSGQQTTVAMLSSTVSSKMLSEMARIEGFYHEETLTGFKWIGSRAQQLHSSGEYRFLLGYEEAIGYCCGNTIFDKDGMSALGIFAELALHAYRQGLTLQQHLQSLYDQYGEFVSNNGYYLLHDTSVVPHIMDHITHQGQWDALQRVGPYEIRSVRYLGEPSYDSTRPDRKPTLPTSQSSPMITLTFTNGCVATFRASGTEPKFKYYVEMKGKPGVKRDAVQDELSKMCQLIFEELLQPSKFGLYRPT